MNTTHYTIGVVAKRYGITAVTLRHYQKIGLLQPTFRKDNGYRVYTEEDLTRLHFILNTKNAGFTLEEIKSLFLMVDNGEPNKSVKNLIHEKLKNIREKILSLKKLITLLEDLDNVCHKKMAARDCPIIKRLKVIPQ